VHKDEAPVRYRLGDLPARGGPDERILVTVDGEHRLADPGDTALIARGCVDEPTRKLAADAYAGLTEFSSAGSPTPHRRPWPCWTPSSTRSSSIPRRAR